MEKAADCLYCQRNELQKSLMIEMCDLSVSTVFLFKEQSHPGRCIVAYKDHVNELFELNEADRNAFMADMNKDGLSKLRNEVIGFVFQGFNLLPRITLAENVALPLVYANVDKKTREERALSMLKAVGLENFADRRPSQISGGQQQRVAIARALVNSPKLILADEPTGNLDTKTSFEIMDIFDSLNKKNGITVVLVTHESDIAEFASRQIHFRDGIVESDIRKEGQK